MSEKQEYKWGDAYNPVEWEDNGGKALNATNLLQSEEYLKDFSGDVFTKVNTNKEDIETLNTSVDNLSASVTNLNTSVNNLDAYLDNLYDDFLDNENYLVQNIQRIDRSLDNKIESATIKLTDKTDSKQGVTKDGTSLKIVVDAYSTNYIDEELTKNTRRIEDIEELKLNKADAANTYSTKTELEDVYNNLRRDILDNEQYSVTNITNINKSLTTINNELENKADKGNTLKDYGITDAYDKKYIDTCFGEVSMSFGSLSNNVYTKDEVYNKTEVNDMIKNSGGSGGTIPDFTEENYLILKCV